MRRTSRLLVLFGIGLAVLTFVLIIALLPNNNPPGGGGGGPNATPTQPANVSVVTAAADIPLGTVVTADMLTTKTVPFTSAARDSFTDTSLVIGQIARRAITTGAQVRAADFDVNQNVSVLQVPPGKRAMSVYVGDLTGVGRLIHIGDTVDVVVTFDEATIKVLTIQPGSQNAQHDDNFRPLTVKAPLLLQDIQVIGTVDQAPATTGSSNQQAANASPRPSAGPVVDEGAKKLIVLAVTDAQAEALLFARYGGTIDLVLRSPADEGTTAATDGVILRTMFEKYGVLPPYVIKTFPIYVADQP